MKKKKIAFLFLIYDRINFAKLWYSYFNSVSNDLYSIYIHYKVDEDLGFFNQFKLKECLETEWGNLSIAKAQNLLFRTAIADPLNYKFILVSQSCIPLKSFNYTYHRLISDNNSYFNLGNPIPVKAGNKLLEVFQSNEIKKASQWIILNRLHTYVALNHEYLINVFDQMYFAADEYYYISVVNRYANEMYSYTNNLTSKATTFTNWSDMLDYPFNYKVHREQMLKSNVRITGLAKGQLESLISSEENFFGDKSLSILKEYKDISKEEIEYLLRDLCLFGRKFEVNCTLDQGVLLEDYLIMKFSHFDMNSPVSSF